jgi:hypothetical protein
MEIYKKWNISTKIKRKKIYKDIAEKQFIMAFFKETLDKLKADKLQRNRSRQRRRVEKQRSGRDAVPSQTQTVCSCHLEIGPKPVDDTL